VFSEDDLLPIAALQHLLFCERQAALMYTEQLWAENPFTLEGKYLHERVDEAPGETRGDVRLARGLRLRSLRLGLTGRADMVELHRLPDDAEDGAAVPGLPGRWRPFPVEYKRGRPKSHAADRVQLCAQALCLEEMLAAPVSAGALFYGKSRRRQEVSFDAALRRDTEAACTRVRSLLESGETPPARREPKCDHCSLVELCRPEAAARSAVRYLEQVRRSAARGDFRGEGRGP